MDGFNAAVDALSGAVFMKVPVLGAQIELIVLYLALPMLFFTLWLGFPNLTAVGRALRILRAQPHAGEAKGDVSRSEEHTSELQSLMRISYAVFCLKKKINKKKYIP